MAGTLTVTGLSDDLMSGEKITGPLTMTGSATIGTITDEPLAVGANTLPVPAGATAVLIVIPQGQTANLQVKTSANASDAGLPIGHAGWAVFPLVAGVTSLTVVSDAVGTIELTFI